MLLKKKKKAAQSFHKLKKWQMYTTLSGVQPLALECLLLTASQPKGCCAATVRQVHHQINTFILKSSRLQHKITLLF